MNVYEVRVHAFGQLLGLRIPAPTEEEAKQMLLDKIGFEVTAEKIGEKEDE